MLWAPLPLFFPPPLFPFLSLFSLSLPPSFFLPLSFSLPPPPLGTSLSPLFLFSPHPPSGPKPSSLCFLSSFPFNRSLPLHFPMKNILLSLPLLSCKDGCGLPPHPYMLFPPPPLFPPLPNSQENVFSSLENRCVHVWKFPPPSPPHRLL